METGKLFSIGHSNHDLNTFINLLRSNKVDIVIDVRSYPYSKYSKHFDREKLSLSLKENGIEYKFMGEGLGGRPRGDEFYDEEGHVLYSKLSESGKFNNDLNIVKELTSKKHVSLMCSEENPEICHRHLLIGRVLNKEGIKINYIRKDNSVQFYDELKSGEKKGSQTTLFGPGKEIDEWISIRSVLPKKLPKTSLKD
jgi:uncharacterized protein (DUF488 family)